MDKYCSHCGSQMPLEDIVCINCGSRNFIEKQGFNSNATYGGYHQSDNNYVEYAGFWRRAVATLIDGIILWIFTAFMGDFLGFIVNWLYQAILESSEMQATLGKKAIGLKVTDLDGNRISFARASGRYFATILSSITFGIGFIMAGFTEKKQALHDIIAGCLVIKED